MDPGGKATTRIGGPDDEELEVPEAVVEIRPGDFEELPEIITVGVEAVGELVVELELSETGPPTVTGLLDEDVGREDDGLVGGELKDVEADEEDELLVVMLTGPTTTEAGPELLLDEIEELELLGLKLDELVGIVLEELEAGGAVDETVELELLGTVLDELVGNVLEELEVLVDPQPDIVV